MLPFNIFSLHDLIGLMVTAPLAIVFYLTYFLLGRRKLDVLFGNLVAICAAICAFTFLADNVVPAGTPSSQIADGPERTLLLLRILLVLAVLETVMLLHFVYRYCGWDRIGPFRVGWVYVLAIVVAPVLWTPWVMSIRLVPLGETSCWLYVVPYFPERGHLSGAFFTLWAAGNLYAVYSLWRYQVQARRQSGGSLTRTRLVLLAVALPSVTGAIDVASGSMGLHASVAMAPIGFTVMGVIMAAALLHARIRAEREKQQLDHELALASMIQQRLLPVQPPWIDGFELAGWSQSANATGGDTYDFMVLPDQQVMVTLGDASGHGMGPALVIAETRAVLRAFAMSQRDPAIILRDAGQLLVMDLPDDRFVTCFVGMLNPATSTLTYAAAGQGPILYYRKQTDEFETSTATGPPLSAMVPAGIGAALEQFCLERGDFIILASDGFYEAPNPAGQRLGIARFVAALHAARHGTVDNLIAAARAEVAGFCEGTDQEDDMTIVVLRKT